MALLGSAVSGEFGLRLLLCPLGSNIVIRTACCTVGIALPVYSTFKSIENKDRDDQEKWLLYWTVYGSFSLAEVFLDKFLYWCPLYYHIKFAFLVWLQLPTTNGAKQLYRRHLRPFLLRHQARLDQLLGVASNEITKFVSTHQQEVQFLKAMVGKLAMTASQLVKDFNHPAQPQGRTLAEGPAAPSRPQIQAAESDSDG